MNPTEEDTATGPAVVVGATRVAATEVFGGAFDDVLATTYDDFAADLSGIGTPRLVGIAAGQGMRAVLAATVARRAESPGCRELVVEVPADLTLCDEVREALSGVPVAGVRRYRDRACLVVGEAPERGPDWLLDALLTAGTTAPDARASHQERLAAEWELAAAQARAQRNEDELARVRQQLRRARAALREARQRENPTPGRRTRGASTSPGVASPAPETSPGHRALDRTPISPTGSTPRRAVRALSRILGARTRRGRLATLAVMGVAAAVVLALPPVLFGLLGGSVGAVVGLALGVGLLGLGLQGVAMLGLLRRSAERQRTGWAEVHRHLDRQDRSLRNQAERIATVCRRDRRLPGAVRRVDRRVADSGRATRRLLHQEVTTLRRQVQATLNLFTMVPPAAGVPPLGGWTVSADLMVEALDVLLEDRPATVVESGSGASTLFLALAVRQHALDTRVVALEHDRRFRDQTRALLARHGVADLAEVRFAPLARTHLPGHHTPWYDESALADLHDIGLLLVDGPPADTGPAARYPIVPLLRDRFAPRCTIVVDDTRRESDREVTLRWRDLLGDVDYTELPLDKGAVVLRTRRSD